MKILGFDPGTATTGYGVIEAVGSSLQLLDYGTIRTLSATPMPERLAIIYDAACQLIERFSPEQIAVEKLYFNTNVTTGITVAQARGVLLLAAAQRQIPVGEYTPLQVKQAIVGYGKAEKQQIQYMISRLLNIKVTPRPDDAADALAIAVCHSNFYQTKALRGE
ncbi:MAG: crossover junction endodeoxyribonuclease RuvC [Clostridia bacterium]|nr:crossover junction endodeoxyribonuclease RuvC [Clostridia bacterium]